MRRLALALFAIIAIATAACEPTEDVQEESSEESAKGVCEDFVKDRLKAPSTANFYDTMAITVGNDKNHWEVIGYVESQNGFGGMVQNRYFCEVTNTDGEMWHLDRLAGLVN